MPRLLVEAELRAGAEFLGGGLDIFHHAGGIIRRDAKLAAPVVEQPGIRIPGLRSNAA